jgi:hypothetical protein
VVAGLVFVNVSAHAQANFTGPWSITMVSESGDYIGGGTERFFDDANAQLHVAEGSSAVDLTISGGTYGESFDLTFQAANGGCSVTAGTRMPNGGRSRRLADRG